MAQDARSSQETVKVVEASPADIDSLSTIVARSFHPVNPYIKKTLPDTTKMRQWWSRIFADQIENTNCHVLTAIDSSDGAAIGILILRLLDSEQKGAGIWTMYDLTPDHDADAFRPMIDGMSEYHERLMLGRPHFLIELFGVDDAYKGRRIGHQLLAQACKIADTSDLETFVQANASAQGFYCRQGFEVEGQTSMPGEVEYVEYMLVRPRKASLVRPM